MNFHLILDVAGDAFCSCVLVNVYQGRLSSVGENTKTLGLLLVRIGWTLVIFEVYGVKYRVTHPTMRISFSHSAVLGGEHPYAKYPATIMYETAVYVHQYGLSIQQ